MANTDMGAASMQVRNDPFVKFALRSPVGAGEKHPVPRKTRWLVSARAGAWIEAT